MYTYEIFRNGYTIYKNEKQILYQYEPYIPYRGRNYVESATNHIAEIEKQDKAREEAEQEAKLNERVKALEKRMTHTQLALAEMSRKGV